MTARLGDINELVRGGIDRDRRTPAAPLLLCPRGVERTFTFPYVLRNALGLTATRFGCGTFHRAWRAWS